MRIVIPSAGLGSRFLPLTRAVPKELLPLGEWPLIHHALLEAEGAGFDSAIIVISPMKRAIRTYFEPAPELERELAEQGNLAALARLREVQSIARRMKIAFIEHWTRGPGQAVLLSRELTGEDTFAVLLPDDVVPSVDHWRELQTLSRETGAPTLCVRKVPLAEARRFGMAICEPFGAHLRVCDLVEKPPPGHVRSNLSIFGRYIVTPPVLDALADRFASTTGELQLTDGYAALIDGAPGVLAVEFSADSYDCGTPQEFARATTRYAAWSASRQLVEVS
jgi:UTP--glucose-1-phosphate uridylyltransferase